MKSVVIAAPVIPSIGINVMSSRMFAVAATGATLNDSFGRSGARMMVVCKYRNKEVLRARTIVISYGYRDHRDGICRNSDRFIGNDRECFRVSGESG